MEEFNSKKRGRSDSDDPVELPFDSPEVKRLREDLLLGNFDDGDLFYPSSSELDSFMKSFEEEILAPVPPVVVDLTSESGESQPELGYLLEASDDELGLPPSTSEEKVELVLVESNSSGSLSSEFWGYSEELPNYDSFDAGIDAFGGDFVNNGGGEYVALDGLFDYSDMGFGSSDFSWRPETFTS